VLLVAILVSAEIGARILMAPIGDHLWAYESEALSRSFEWYRQLTQTGRTPDAVAIGDSTGARNFDPAEFARASSLPNVYSLARAGNFPRALLGNTLPLLDQENVPGIVILLQWPGSLRDDPRIAQIEAGAVSSILDARRTGKFMITDYLHVTRLFPARSYLRSYWLRDDPLLRPPANGGFSPFERPPGSSETTSAPFPVPSESAVFSAERRDVVRELVALAQRRHFTLLAIVGPFRSGKQNEVANRHLEWLRELEANACENLVVVDFREIDGLEPQHFKDDHHLYRDGAAIFSNRLGMLVSDIRRASSGERASCQK